MYRKIIIMLLIASFFTIVFSSIFIYKNTEDNYKRYLDNFIFEENRKLDLHFERKMDNIIGIVESHAYWDEAILYLNKKDEKWISKNATSYIVENDIFSIDGILIADEEIEFVQETGVSLQNVLLNNVYIQETLKDDIDSMFIDCFGGKEYIVYSTPFKNDAYEEPTGVYIAILQIDVDYLNDVMEVLSRNAYSINLLCEDCENYDISDEELIIYHRIANSNYSYKISYDSDFLKSFFIANRIMLIVIISAMLLLIIIVLFLFIKRIRRHIKKVVDAIVNVSKGNYNNKISTNDMLISDFNTLAAAVDTLSTTINEKNKLVEQSYVEMVDLLYKAVSVIDLYTANHGLAVAHYSKLVCDLIDYRDVDNVFLAAKIHDIGKIAIPVAILNKPSKITKEEFEIMKMHSTYGYEIVSKVEYFKYAKFGVKYHHEAWDGSGYPEGLKGNDIPITAQIIALADIYDALTTARVYRNAFSHEQAKKIIVSERGKKLNPILVEIFIENENEFRKLNDKINSSRMFIDNLDDFS